uniref:Uncharacterized protein n=1 Tax=Anguilla anguilla TaxID=7936 RepID=A0A0E9QE99_ANGAN
MCVITLFTFHLSKNKPFMVYFQI